MSDKRARYIGSPDGVDLTVPVATPDEPPRHVHVPHGGELPTEIDGHKVPASVRNSLLEQADAWTLVNRATGAATKRAAKNAPADEPAPDPAPEPEVTTDDAAPAGQEEVKNG